MSCGHPASSGHKVIMSCAVNRSMFLTQPVPDLPETTPDPPAVPPPRSKSPARLDQARRDLPDGGNSA